MSAERIFKRDFYPRYKIEDWKNWEGQWELIEGIPWAMTPMPARKHQLIVKNLLFLFADVLKGCPRCQEELPPNYMVDAQTMLHPDMVVVCDAPIEGIYLTERPSLVVEVLSPATYQKDLHVKTEIYAQAGIPYYLIVHPEEEWVRVLILKGGEWEIGLEGHEGRFEFDFKGCKVSAEFGAIWAA